MPLPDDGTLSAGATFLVIFGSLFAAYLFGGMAIMKFVKGAQGVEVIPNYGFWSSLPSLVKVQNTKLLLQFWDVLIVLYFRMDSYLPLRGAEEMPVMTESKIGDNNVVPLNGCKLQVAILLFI